MDLTRNGGNNMKPVIESGVIAGICIVTILLWFLYFCKQHPFLYPISLYSLFIFFLIEHKRNFQKSKLQLIALLIIFISFIGLVLVDDMEISIAEKIVPGFRTEEIYIEGDHDEFTGYKKIPIYPNKILEGAFSYFSSFYLLSAIVMGWCCLKLSDPKSG